MFDAQAGVDALKRSRGKNAARFRYQRPGFFIWQ